MEVKQITPDFAVSAQIAQEDILALKATGFRAIICNRPDQEDMGQPDFRDIADAAREAGLEARHVPVVSGMITPEDVASFEAALSDLPKPVLAYCRSGARAANLWSLLEGARQAGTANV